MLLSVLLCLIAITACGAMFHMHNPSPVGWEPFKDKCYLFAPDRKDWLSSQYSCLSVGSHLALIQNEEAQKAVRKS
uniref:C-type lectin domain-containing protein n=1 Tax=Electrophorus electricus TaxID=8005 RepID=A0AAY5EKT4_ELEEL